MPVPVLLTNGDQRSALAVARSLHTRGVEVLALAPETQGYASHTRALREVIRAPGADADPRGFMDALQHVIRQRGIGLVIPISDEDLVTLDAARHTLGDVRVGMASSESLRLVLDKRANLELAALHGVPVPREFRLQHRDQLDEMIAQLGWPIVMKRQGSPIDPRVPPLPFRFRILRDRAQLEAAIDALPVDQPFPLFQEFIRGGSMSLCCMAVRGEVVAIHQYQSLRAWQGCSVLRRIVQAHPLLEEHARRLLRALEWDGIAHVGFLGEPEHGRIGYLEVNGRFWASTQASVDAGWDFPWWAYRWFVDGLRPDIPPLRLGSETIWHYGDLLTLADYLRGGASPTPGAAPGPRLATRHFLQGWLRGARSETFRWKDPGPALLDARHALRDGWRLAARSLGLPRPAKPATIRTGTEIALSRNALRSLRDAGQPPGREIDRSAGIESAGLAAGIVRR